MPSPEPMTEPLSDAAALSDDESALLKRVVAGVAREPDAEPAIRDLVESVLAKRIAELHAANASLEREVQERQLVELALRESETRLRDLALTTADWLWEVDPSGRYTSCSDRVMDVLGNDDRAALRESETRLRDLALTTADWLWEVDPAAATPPARTG